MVAVAVGGGIGGETPVGVEEVVDSLSDLQLAWENIEVARTLMQGRLNHLYLADEKNHRRIQSTKRILGDILVRLGDLECQKDNFGAALKLYEQGL